MVRPSGPVFNSNRVPPSLPPPPIATAHHHHHHPRPLTPHTHTTTTAAQVSREYVLVYVHTNSGPGHRPPYTTLKAFFSVLSSK